MDFVADLRQLTLNCEFEAFLNQALHDRFVCGLKLKVHKSACCQKTRNSPLVTLLKFAQGMELAESKAKEFKESQSAVFQVSLPKEPG